MTLREAWETIGNTFFANLQKHEGGPSLNLLVDEVTSFYSSPLVDGRDFPELSLLLGTRSKEGGKQLDKAAAPEDEVKTNQRRSRGHHLWSPS